MTKMFMLIKSSKYIVTKIENLIGKIISQRWKIPGSNFQLKRKKKDTRH